MVNAALTRRQNLPGAASFDPEPGPLSGSFFRKFTHIFKGLTPHAGLARDWH